MNIERLSKKQLREVDWSVTSEIKDSEYGEYTYTKNTKICKKLNKLLSSDFRYVFVKHGVSLGKQDGVVDIDHNTIYVVTKDGGLVKLWGSEWGGISLVGNKSK